MASADDLRAILRRIDGRGYKAYRDLRGAFDLGPLRLYVDHVQADPFAAPSRLRLRVSQERARLDPAWLASRARRTALEDFLARGAQRELRRGRAGRRGSGKSGRLEIDAGAQEVLERSAVVATEDFVEARIRAGLPAAGRRVLGREAEELLCEALPAAALASLTAEALDPAATRHFVECVENQEVLRRRLPELGLLAFVADGARLPRESGASQRPATEAEVVPWRSPDSLRLELPLENAIATPEGPCRSWIGSGIPRGVTLIVGGGYHGKSTLLRALERGVYPHVPGDGREGVVSDPGLVKIRAEDGRRVEGVDIHAFIGELPRGRSTAAFRSDDASGSTSQAAGIVEALEAGASGLLLDEDTSATNFMVRDARMQALVAAEHEPITPFLERVRELYDGLGVSTVLVMGGVGDYFEVADRVLCLRDFRPADVTEEARRIAAAGPRRRREARAPLRPAAPRIPLGESLDASRGRRDVSVEARGLDWLGFGEQAIDLRGLEQIVDPSQARAIGLALHLAAERWMDGRRTLPEVLDALEALLDEQGLDALAPGHRAGHHPGELARPRRFEVAAVLSRLRSLRTRAPDR